MSGFQIPGLGQAKPNESLPPVPVDTAIAAVASAGPEEHMPDAESSTAQPTVLATEAAPSSSHGDGKPAELQDATEAHTATEDSMVVDRAESPSLTSALEAAIGGLGETATETTEATEVIAMTTAEPQPPLQEPAGTVELQNDQGDNPEWEIDSSPYESSTDSSSSDSSDEDSDNEGYELLGVEETARLLMDAEAGGSDDEGERGGRSGNGSQLRTKNELAEEAIPRPDVTITVDMKIEELGSVEHIVENIMLIKAFTPGEYQVLDTGSVLCNADRVVIGAVAETIGKVLQPMYTVRFNSEDEIKELGVELGTKIFYPVDHASFVFTEPLKNMKGSDASNIHDEEVGDDEMEFSDDEKEAEYKRSLKQKKNKNKAGAAGDGGARGGGHRGAHPLRQEVSASSDTLNYDDDDGPYKPLTRPPGFGAGGPSSEPVELPPRSGFHRGGRRGEHRGRGGRGRGGFGRGGRGGGNNPPRDGYSQAPHGYGQYPQHAQQPQQQPQQQPAWAGPSHPAPPSQAPAPSMPAFGFQFPGWPQPQGQQGVPSSGPLPPPPPPPGWPGQGQQQQQQPGGGAFVNPALLAALMSQMQAQRGGQQWGGQQQHPPPS
ncbi:hypothetical protein PLICBS_003702 [Purpureocillium lilacinum]|uniref:uncharacterized protein n=1 Tax=Purpureocillium lilacinum TaxID=33203 RepID=UPI0020837FE7|nr:hypothetical protein PLICBS_003702 [Purpureocillium lilacinum]